MRRAFERADRLWHCRIITLARRHITGSKMARSAANITALTMISQVHGYERPGKICISGHVTASMNEWADKRRSGKPKTVMRVPLIKLIQLTVIRLTLTCLSRVWRARWRILDAACRCACNAAVVASGRGFKSCAIALGYCHGHDHHSQRDGHDASDCCGFVMIIVSGNSSTTTTTTTSTTSTTTTTILILTLILHFYRQLLLAFLI
jgi:hypothetical protein